MKNEVECRLSILESPGHDTLQYLQSHTQLGLAEAGRDLGRLPGPTPAQSRSARAGCSGLCLPGFSIPSGLQIAWPLWAPCALTVKRFSLCFSEISHISLSTHCLFSCSWILLWSAGLPPLQPLHQIFFTHWRDPPEPSLLQAGHSQLSVSPCRTNAWQAACSDTRPQLQPWPSPPGCWYSHPGSGEGKVIFFDMLATLCLIQLRRLWAFCTARALFWIVSHLSTRDLSSFSTELFSSQMVPACPGAWGYSSWGSGLCTSVSNFEHQLISPACQGPSEGQLTPPSFCQ